MIRHAVCTLRYYSVSYASRCADSVRQVRDSEVHFLKRHLSISTFKMAFDMSQYDCVGFDLDFTLVQYNMPALVNLEYDLLAKFLVEVKGYSREHLLQPLSLDMELMQKGLFIDFERGNVVKLNADGVVCGASHGTRFLDSNEVASRYGPDMVWDFGRQYCEDPLQAWNGPLAEKIRAVLDYFDTPSVVAYSRCVDSIQSGASQGNIWHDILDGFGYLFDRSHFSSGKGDFFAKIKANPEKYYYKTDAKVITWLKELKKRKFTYLISGSYIDFIGLTAGYGLGQDWRQWFDVIVCYAKKPAFFYELRPYLSLDGDKEVEEVALTSKGIYSQGNWTELYNLMKKETGLDAPKCVYVGDNLIQDVYAPAKSTCCDTVAVSAELGSFNVVKSGLWGNYLTGSSGRPSYWSQIMAKHAECSVRCVDDLLT